MRAFTRTIFVCLLSFLMAKTAFGELTDGIVAYYPLLDGTNAGTINGATLTEDRFGRTNSAYHFNGNEFIQIDGDDNLNFGASIDFTMDAWIKAKSSQPGMYPVIIGRRASDVTRSGYLFFLWSDGRLAFQLSYGENSHQFGNYTSTGDDLRDDTWHHVAVICDRDGYLTFYIDGVQTGQSVAVTGNIDSASDILIGWDEGNPSHTYFNGVIDDIHIYNRVLSETEVKQLFYQENSFCVTNIDTNGSTAEGIAQCQAAPHTYGLFDQTDIDIATTAGKQGCIDNPASCNLFSQADVDAAKTAGIQLVIANPHDYGLFAQADIDAIKYAAIEEGRQICISAPSICGLFNQTDIDNAEETGKQAGIVLVKAAPHAYGLFAQADIDAAKAAGIAEVIANPSSHGLFAQADIDTAKSAGIAEGKQICITNPASCGIATPEEVIAGCIAAPDSCAGLYNQAQLDEAKAECKTDPASCGILIDPAREEVIAGCIAAPDSCTGLYNQAQLDAAKAECKANPASCGIPTQDEIIAECIAAPDSCAGLYNQAQADAERQAGFEEGKLAGVQVTLSHDLALHIPVLHYSPLLADTIPLWADFQYVPSEDNRILFEITEYGYIE